MGPSSLTKINDALHGVTTIGVDTSPIIYFVEAHPKYEPLVTAAFQQLSSGALRAVTSVVTLAETLVRPLVNNDTRLQALYRGVLLQTGSLDTRPIDWAVAEQAADLRARYRLRTPDALQIAVALGAGCEAFLTNDLTLKRVTELRVLVLDELEL
jgi:predicted nucleic acid-binding protein